MTVKTVSIKIRRKLNQVGRDLSWKLGLDNNRFEYAAGSRILAYHGITKLNPFRFNTLFISLDHFEKQLCFYKKYFHCVSLEDYFQGNHSGDKFTICLTFDDGFANNYEYVLPLLEKYQVPAAFFITSIRAAGYDYLWNDLLSIAGFFGPAELEFNHKNYTRKPKDKYVSKGSGHVLSEELRKATFSARTEFIRTLEKRLPFRKLAHQDYWQQMTTEQIRLLSKSKWATIGSHSYYHNDLVSLDAAALKQDLKESKYFLENLIQKEVRSLAFPYGSYNRLTINEAKNTGYDQLLATEFLFNEDQEDQCMRERLTINPFISPLNQMHANISGKYN